MVLKLEFIVDNEDNILTPETCNEEKIVALSDVILLKSALYTPIEDKVLSIYIYNKLEYIYIIIF